MVENRKLLIIDDDPDIVLTIELILNNYFKTINSCSHPKEVSKVLKLGTFDVVLLDMNFTKGATNGQEGLDCLDDIKKVAPGVSIVVMTAYGDIDLAVQAIKMGAIDFIVKPWNNEKLLATVLSACKHTESNRTINNLKQKQNALISGISNSVHDMIGSSKEMNKLRESICRVAKTNANVLILGENGSGKELVARAIYKNSELSNEAFVNVDLGALSESLFESELFGHVKGAYTDAKENRAGRFEIADNGTLFLDEIGNVKLEFQSKLLSVIQNQEVFRLGSSNAIPVKVRLICATNLPMNKLKDEGFFRQDLLYRINTVELRVPSLRERVEDINELVEHFLIRIGRKYNKPQLSVSNQVIKKLQKYNWPGNIRELKHVVERAVIMSDKTKLDINDFVLHEQTVSISSTPSLTLDVIERKAIMESLHRHKWNYSIVAKELGIGRTTLYRKINKYGI